MLHRRWIPLQSRLLASSRDHRNVMILRRASPRCPVHPKEEINAIATYTSRFEGCRRWQHRVRPQHQLQSPTVDRHPDLTIPRLIYFPTHFVSLSFPFYFFFFVLCPLVRSSTKRALVHERKRSICTLHFFYLSNKLIH